MATEPERITPDHSPLFHGWASRFGVDGLDIETRYSDAPGGDAANIANTQADDDLRAFIITYDFAEADGTAQRRTVIHELLHIAFRHVGSVERHITESTAKTWLRQAIEEDTEALAEAIERWIDK